MQIIWLYAGNCFWNEQLAATALKCIALHLWTLFYSSSIDSTSSYLVSQTILINKLGRSRYNKQTYAKVDFQFTNNCLTCLELIVTEGLQWECSNLYFFYFLYTRRLAHEILLEQGDWCVILRYHDGITFASFKKLVNTKLALVNFRNDAFYSL